MLRLALAVWALPALAAAGSEEPIGAEGFRALAEGWTLHFEREGRHFGSEQYLEGGRSIWRAGDAECERGLWYEADGAICFIYETVPLPQCWHVFRRDGEIFARPVDDPDGRAELRLSGRDRAPLACPGPSLGV
ncbi:MAG: hypothetical protein D6686_02915 [Alphaproteobacteria bacterium]|nr:MAG: hypothetical protein D6686_02915 [Alphaproteobacteria bacterium]